MKSASKKRVRRKPAAAKQSAQRILEERLREAEETLDAIRQGHVDAVVVQGPAGEQVFTLKGADHRYRQLVETMNEGALMVGPDGLIVYANARFAALVGLPLEKMIGTPVLQYVVDTSQALVEAMLQNRGGAPLRSEAELVVADRGRVPVYLSATAGWDADRLLTCLMVTDLSEQKRNHEMLAAERLTSQIVEQAAEGIVVCDPDHLIIRASQAVSRITGRSPLLRPFEELFEIGTADRPDAARALVESALRGETTTGLEVTLALPDGASRDLLVSAAPVASAGDVLGCVISFVDISARKQAAVERLRLLEAAEAARNQAESANGAKDEFLAMLGHELRNPLAPIMTALDLMNMKPDETYRRERDIIERQVRHVVTLVGDLLDVSRIARGKVDLERIVVDLAHVIDNAVESTAPLVDERRHEIHVSVDPGLWVEGDEARLCQVFANLITNAAKYTPRGGKIAVAATRQDGELVVLVRDNGAGIAPELLPNLFDMFVQGKRTLERAGGGLGLGLAIVRSLVTLHGGSVGVRSAGVGHGSEFEVRLPSAPHDAVAQTEVAEVAAASPPASPRRVLVVDDNVDAAEMLALGLETLGHEVRVAHDGLAALDIAATFAPDVAVVDIGLPAMDGYELARRLRERCNGDGAPRLIAVTGYGRACDREHALGVGFDDHMVKPVDLVRLESTISAL